MTLEYRCNKGHTTEQFFRSISAGAEVPTIQCPCCSEIARKIFSVPLGFGLYGPSGGFDKPSPTKRFSTKTVSQIEGNSNAVG